MKRCIITFIALLSAGVLFAQQGVDPSMIGIDTAQQQLREVSVDRFEHDAFWSGRMSSDTGFIQVRLFEGGPLGKEDIPGEEELNIQDIHVLGARIDFLRRGHTSFFINARRPIPIEGVTKTISVWAVGRNFNHTLHIIIQDLYGRQFSLPMGRLNFQGWKQLTVAVPSQPLIGRAGIIQQDFNRPNNIGISVVGFRVDIDPTQAFGTYYLYLDDLRAVTDLFPDNSRDPDDMSDAW
jgi:hypothetical protein